MSESSPRAPLSELVALFIRLGCTAFGGPAAHVAIMQTEVVERRGWLSSERFLDLLGTANLIPGPSSTELAIFIGYEMAGLSGLLLAGLCFILPSALIVTALAWGYVRFGGLPHVGDALAGITPVVIAVVGQAIWNLAPKALKGAAWLFVVAVGAAVAALLHAPSVDVLLGAGLANVACRRAVHRGRGGGVVVSGGLAKGVVLLAAPPGLAALFVTFAKAGGLVFGSGYVLLAFLREDLVTRLHWLTEQQLLDAVAVGQVTPGPVFTTATFIGYVLGGGWGALVATAGIFLPGFVLVGLSRPLVSRIRKSPLASEFLDGVNVAALSLMTVVDLELARTALHSATSVVIVLASTILLLRFRVNVTWLVMGGAVLGGITGPG